jgi:3'(2'), 5'-bisphosphate nucleotidase
VHVVKHEFERGLLDELSSLVSAAGQAILAARLRPLRPRAKSDQSPVCAADEAAEAVILDGLARLLPGVCVVSEEAAARSSPGSLPSIFVLVDPLDGTRDFLAGRDEFTVNVAIVESGRVTLGIVGAPARGTLWRGIEGGGADRLQLEPGAPARGARERAAIKVRPCPASGLVVAVSRSHLDGQTEAFVARLPVLTRLACGSAIKFCELAQGTADCYPRLSPTCEWDVAAGHAVLAAAGGLVLTPDGQALRYGQAQRVFRIEAFVAWGDPAGFERFGAGELRGAVPAP